MGVCGRDQNCRRPCKKKHTHTVEEFVAFQPYRDVAAPSGVGRGIYATRLTSRDVTELSLPGPEEGAVAKAFALERLMGTRHDSFAAILGAADANNRTQRVPKKRVHSKRVRELVEDHEHIDPFAILSPPSSAWGSPTSGSRTCADMGAQSTALSSPAAGARSIEEGKAGRSAVSQVSAVSAVSGVSAITQAYSPGIIRPKF